MAITWVINITQVMIYNLELWKVWDRVKFRSIARAAILREGEAREKKIKNNFFEHKILQKFDQANLL